MELSTEERIERLSLGISAVRIRLSKFNPNHVPSGPKGGQFASGSERNYAPKSMKRVPSTATSVEPTGEAKVLLDSVKESAARQDASYRAWKEASENYAKASGKEADALKSEIEKQLSLNKASGQEVRDVFTKQFSGGTVGKLAPSMDKSFHPDVKEEIEKGFADFNNTFGNVGLKSVKVVAASPNERPYYDSKTNTMHVPNNAGNPMCDASVIIHELGHAVHHSSKVSNDKIVGKWFDTRVGEFEQPKSLAKIYPGQGWPRDEVAYPDKFMDAYMGKVYTRTAWSGDRAFHEEVKGREIPSMGMELLYKSPYKLAKSDPDMFNFLMKYLDKARR